MSNNGLIFGIFLVLGLTNIPIFMPILLTYSAKFIGPFKLQKKYKKLAFLLLIKIIFIIIIQAIFSNKDTSSLLKLLTPDIIILFFLFITVDKNFLKGLSIPIFVLLIVDLSFNLYAFVYGKNIYGVDVGFRPEDILPRVGGIFDHPFYSKNISLVALFTAIATSKNYVIILSIFGLMINGTFRSPLSLFIIIFLYIVFKIKSNKNYLFPIFYSVVLGIFMVTIYSALNTEFQSGNYLRYFAWTNSLSIIKEYPLLGFHEFNHGSFNSMDLDTISNFGIAESTYLQYAVDYGIPLSILSFFIYYIITRIAINQFYNTAKISSIAVPIMASFAFIDSFYGDFIGSFLTTTIYAIICISYNISNEK